jgi:hypothetical protein
MAIQDPTARADFVMEEVSIRSNMPTVSWGAIFAGAVSAAALSFVLLAIGAAFGLSVASPWDFTGREAADTAAAAGIGAAIFLIIVHAISSGTGGYLAGRLRPKPTGLRGDETYFRDTAHGLVVWAVSAVATILMIACLAMAAASGGVALTAAGIGAAGQAAQGAAAGAAPALMGDMRDRDSLGYVVDSMFRPAGPAPAPSGETGGTGQAATNSEAAQPAAPSATPGAGGAANLPLAPTSDVRGRREEVGRVLRVAFDGELSQEDKAYLTQLVAQETGMTQPEAEQRVNQVMEKAQATKAEAEQKAKEAADAARKAGMYTALWGAVAMLAGAFSAALAATWGGRTRDA